MTLAKRMKLMMTMKLLDMMLWVMLMLEWMVVMGWVPQASEAGEYRGQWRPAASG